VTISKKGFLLNSLGVVDVLWDDVVKETTEFMVAAYGGSGVALKALKNAKKRLLPEISRFNETPGLCHRTISLIDFHTEFFVFFLKSCPSLFCAKNSSDKFARWRHRHSLSDEFLCVFVVFKNVPTQNPMFYTRVPLELSQLVVTLDCISTRKLNLLCLSNIVFYRFKSRKWVFLGADLSVTITQCSNNT